MTACLLLGCEELSHNQLGMQANQCWDRSRKHSYSSESGPEHVPNLQHTATKAGSFVMPWTPKVNFMPNKDRISSEELEETKVYDHHRSTKVFATQFNLNHIQLNAKIQGHITSNCTDKNWTIHVTH